MDEELAKLVGLADGQKDMSLKVLDLQGTVEFSTPQGEKRYALKRLKELYGAGVNTLSIVPDSPEYMPLFLGIEEAIVGDWNLEPGMTDGQVSLALDRLAMNPEADVIEELQAHIQLRLRLLLSIGDYSRKDVQRALRIVSKSVSRHTRAGGRQGYLTFIRSFLG